MAIERNGDQYRKFWSVLKFLNRTGMKSLYNLIRKNIQFVKICFSYFNTNQLISELLIDVFLIILKYSFITESKNYFHTTI